MDLRVRKPDGWPTISVPDDVETLSVAGGQTESGAFALMLIGERSKQPNWIESGILDVDPADESHLDNGDKRTAPASRWTDCDRTDV